MDDCECDCIADSWGCDKCISIEDESIEDESIEDESIEDISNVNVLECTCVNCMCGKMKCWICGVGDVPLDYDPCIFHDECKAKLKGCYTKTITEVEINGTWSRQYSGPFECCDTVGTVCSHCRTHPDFVTIFVNGLK